MPVLTEPRRAGEFILTEANGNISRDTVTIKSGSGLVKAGTVLGKLTADSKYVPSPAAGADGSQIGLALNIYAVDATAADVKVAVVARDAEVNRNILSYEASVNDDAKRAAKAAQLAAVGILVR
jgi:hypothetical protein